MMNEEQLKIRALSLEEAWNVFKTEAEMTDQEYKQSRYGVEIKFDIYDYFMGNIIIKQKKGLVKIGNATYRLTDLYTELELRERIMKDYLEEAFQEDELVTSRIGSETYE